jgi:ribosomal protein S18 acetylase RimI-like enzyme
MSTTPTIREVHPNDAEAFLAHLKRFLSNPAPDKPIPPTRFNPTIEQITENIVENYLTLENWLMLVAEVDGQIIGSVTCNGGADATTMHSALLSIAVEKTWQEQGIGTLLMEKAVAWAKKSQVVTELTLDVYADHTQAIYLYEKFGFKTKYRKRASHSESEAMPRDILIMQLDVKD